MGCRSSVAHSVSNRPSRKSSLANWVPAPRKFLTRQKTDVKVRAAMVTGGGMMATAIIAASGAPLKVMEAVLTKLAGGPVQARRLRTLCQKMSMCIATGRISAEHARETLYEPMLVACDEFVRKEQRVHNADLMRERLSAAVDAGYAMTDAARNLQEHADPTDITHAAFSKAIKVVGEAIAALLAPHLSVC